MPLAALLVLCGSSLMLPSTAWWEDIVGGCVVVMRLFEDDLGVCSSYGEL